MNGTKGSSFIGHYEYRVIEAPNTRENWKLYKTYYRFVEHIYSTSSLVKDKTKLTASISNEDTNVQALTELRCAHQLQVQYLLRVTSCETIPHN